jgi:hypothetical protein
MLTITADEILRKHGIRAPSKPGRHYAVCPQCSAQRKPAHRNSKVLGITIDGDGVTWGCNHCGWTGGEKFEKPKGPNGRARATPHEYQDENGVPIRRKMRNPPGVTPRFWWQHPDGNGGWTKGGGNAPKTLYRLPELREDLALGHPIFIAEGEKDVDNLRALGVPATCNPDGAPKPGQHPKWTPEFSEALRGADLFIIPDHDEQGYAHADAIVQMSAGIANSIRVLKLAEHWPDCPKGGDISDWLAAGHTREELDALIMRARNPQVPDRIRLQPFDAITLSTKPSYLMKGILPRVGLAVIWGPPKCGKSFFTFDLMMHVAIDWPYRGHRVQQGPVVYLALEGGSGLNKRVEAWRRHHLADHRQPVPFYLLDVPVNLIADHAALIASIKAQLGENVPAAIVVDTLNRSLVGSESKDEDMAKFIRAGDAVRAAFECLVAIVHHCGVEGTRPRGHTSLTGAADAQLAIEKDEDDNIIATVEHMKDDESGTVIVSRLEHVGLDNDDDDDPITSRIVVPSETTAKGPKLPAGAKRALEQLQDLIADSGLPAPASNHIPSQTKVVFTDTWRETFYKTHPGNKTDTKQKAFVRAVERLQEAHLVGIWSEFAWLARQPDMARQTQKCPANDEAG